ncbi:unnamed protein product, partial [Brachionus calyciflorus]
MKIEISKYKAPDIQNLNEQLKEYRKQLLEKFIIKWSNHNHKEEEKNSTCSKLLNIDGNFKCTRLKCMHSGTRLMSKELEPVSVGCVKTPERDSYFCYDHRDSSRYIFFTVEDKTLSFHIDQIKPDNVFENKISKIHDCFYTREENYLFLSELTNNKLVWVTENQIDATLFEDFFRKKNSFADKLDLECQTLKSKTLCDFKTRTKGILISAFNCGIVTGYREIFGSESCSQVLLFYLDVIEKFKKPPPEFLIYDDACHLKKMTDKKKIWTKSERAKNLEMTKFAIDKFHFGNHKDKWC